MDVKSTISDAQKKALETEIEDINAWFENWVHHRANMLIDEIFQQEVQRLIDDGQTISGTKDEIVLESPILSAAERNKKYKLPKIAKPKKDSSLIKRTIEKLTKKNK
mgnify:CR=1 FL=1